MLEQEAALLTQVLARGARNDPLLVLVTLGRARRERSSVEADCYWPLGMVQCLGHGESGLAGTPCAAGGTSGICSWMLLLQIQGFGKAPRAGGEGRLRLLSRAAVPAVNQAGLSPGGGRDRDRRWL